MVLQELVLGTRYFQPKNNGYKNPERTRITKMASEKTIDINVEPVSTAAKKENTSTLVGAIFGEFVGMTFFIFLALTAAQGATGMDASAKILMIAAGFGLSLMVSIMMVARVSGGHLNPAVTVALASAGLISLTKAIFYIVAQCLGATAGALLAHLVTQGSLVAYNEVAPGTAVGSAFLAEILLTFVLVLTVFTTAVDGKVDPGFAPTLIGFSVFAIHLSGIPIDGTSVNPARTFGASVVTSHWDNHWVFWAGPIIGGLLASGTHKIFKLAV
ncbi:Aquaporin-4 [Terramyces sp. JEL0728]|nr:Aquaporin-4 [Terramyces sp. JEL0728]